MAGAFQASSSTVGFGNVFRLTGVALDRSGSLWDRLAKFSFSGNDIRVIT